MSHRRTDQDRTTLLASVRDGVQGPLGSACVVVIHGERLGRRIDIDRRPVVIGRSEDADLVIPHSSVSRKHCELWRDGDRYRVRDLKATNSTRVNDVAIDETELADGDHIAIGDCLLKFIHPSSVEARYHAAIHLQATNDALTELPNRRHFVEAVDKLIVRATRLGTTIAMCIVDVDHFKKINDDYGHIAGDDALREVALVLRRFVRPEDIAARIGGEEFAVVLADCSAEEAVARFAEPLRAAVEQTPFVFSGQPRQITVSVGICGLSATRSTRSALMQGADAALYQAKDEARNCVRVQAP
jgi:diguanylate cyclase (GGDEF)-like protein